MKRYLARFFICMTLGITMLISVLFGLFHFFNLVFVTIAYIIAFMACYALFLELRLWLDDWYIEEVGKILQNEESNQNN